VDNPVSRFFASRGFARTLGAIGRFMITSGTVILLLVAYQLWGTNLQTDKSQSSLASQFNQTLGGADAPQTDPSTVDASSTTSTTSTTAPASVTTATEPVKLASAFAAPQEGSVIGRISIPSIGLHDFYFVEGKEVADLKRGAGHYPGTPLPGQKGNSAIAGHRTTYGAPFHNIDKVKPGDPIRIDTIYGTFTYMVTSQEIVKPTDVSVLDDRHGNTLTLTACHPKFSAKQRLITFATLVGNPVPKLKNQDAQAEKIIKQSEGQSTTSGGKAIDDFSSEPIVRFPSAWWGLGCMALWISIRLLAWFGHRSRKYPRWVPYLVGTPFALLMLYFFFEVFSYEAFTRALNLNI